MVDTKTTASKVPETIRNPNPKQRFMQSTTFLKAHHDLVDSESFGRGIDFALLQYQSQLNSRTVDAITASAAGFKLQGVLEFIAVLRNLADKPIESVRRPDDNLTH